MDTLKKPPVMAAMIGALLLIVSKFLGWMSVAEENVLTAILAEEMNSRMTIALVIGIIGAVFTYLGAQKGSKGFFITNIIIGLYMLLVVFQSRLNAEAELLGVESGMGYYLALLGALLFVGGSIGAVMSSKGKRRPHMASAA